MSIPAIAPPPAPPPPGGFPPGFSFGGLTGAIDDTAGSGVVIPLNLVDDTWTQWRLTSVSGWDSAGLEEGAENKTGADGAWDTANYFGSRIVELGGLIVAPDSATREVARARLEQATPPRRLITLRFEETTPKQVVCRRSGRLLMDDLTDTTTQFSLSLLAPDPRKYGADLVQAVMSIAPPGGGLAPPWTPPVLLPARAGAADTVTVTNAGTYETPPLIRFDGPGADLQILNLTTGTSLAFDLELGAGDFLLIDADAGAALLGGTTPRAPLPGSTVISKFFIAPGANQLHFAGTATDAQLVATATVQFSPAWM